MSKKELKPGSKMDKAVKLMKALNAVADLAPWGGGLAMDPALMAMHDELSKRFDGIAQDIGITEGSLVMLVKEYMQEE